MFPMELKITKSNFCSTASVFQDKRPRCIKSSELSYQNLVGHATDTVRLALKYWMIFFLIDMFLYVFNNIFL